ncbi:phage adaptor protein [Delftia tsuruhatensis]|uniref:phage adaptor protein n=1 Tax=Delftia tsuruhatensis TaxID=180282 RepID=UPI00244C5929|nr:DUF6682 family protein [Delftia tsuruhatensis]MDH0849251.1 hypothetical protein [Delftia tsuruhatensis]
MALTVAQLLDDAARDLQDKGHIRWTRADLLDWFNAAQRAFAEQRPDQMAQPRDLVLAAGWRQALPADALTLIDITNNANATQRRITKTDLWVLDAVAGAWRSGSPGREVQHYMHDLGTPQEFLVYPPVAAGTKVRAVLGVAAVDLADENGTPSVPERWMDALRHFVLFRAWSIDAEFGGNATIAAAHRALYNEALGIQAQAAATTAVAQK